MRLLKTIAFILISLSLSGCINEDWSDCLPVHNAQITFTYTGDTNDQTMFSKMIDQVTLFVFNVADGDLKLVRELKKEELSRLQGVNLNLEPGDYKIVCWGNANINTQITANKYASSKISNKNYRTSEPLLTESHLYFGELALTILPNQLTAGDVFFKGAHINMELYVKGFHSKPTIEICNLGAEYDFSMRAIGSFTQTYYPVSVYDTTKKLDAAIFQLFRFNDDNPVEIRIKNAAQELKQLINLKNYMVENNLHVNNRQEATISMLIEFSDVGVSITVPDWEQNQVMPGNE